MQHNEALSPLLPELFSQITTYVSFDKEKFSSLDLAYLFEALVILPLPDPVLIHTILDAFEKRLPKDLGKNGKYKAVYKAAASLLKNLQLQEMTDHHLVPVLLQLI